MRNSETPWNIQRGGWRDCPQLLLDARQMTIEAHFTDLHVQGCHVEPEGQANIFCLMAEAIVLDFRLVILAPSFFHAPCMIKLETNLLE